MVIERQSGLRKTRFFKKNNPPVFFNPYFEKKHVFVLFF